MDIVKELENNKKAVYCNGEIVALKDMRNNDLITQTSSATRCLLMIAENDTLLQNIYQSFLPLTKLPIDKYSMKMIGCEEIIAFGDGHNDIDMLQYAGLGVAMGNASVEVKEAADIVTKRNDEEGLRYILDRAF